MMRTAKAATQCTWSNTSTALTQTEISVTVMISSLATFCSALIAWKLS